MDAPTVNVAKAPSSHVLNKNLSPLSLKKCQTNGVGGGCGSTKTSTTDLSIAAVQQQQDEVAVQNNNYSNLDMESLDDMLRKVIFNLNFFFAYFMLCGTLGGRSQRSVLSQLVLLTLGHVPTSSLDVCFEHRRLL